MVVGRRGGDERKEERRVKEKIVLLRWRKEQGWEFAHLISKRIACFLSKNERMSNLLKKMSDSLIRSFLLSEMSDSLTSLISSEQPEHIAHGRSFFVSEMSDLLTSLI